MPGFDIDMDQGPRIFNSILCDVRCSVVGLLYIYTVWEEDPV